jgi:ubiquinone/menaquinone biosynthesis C-methylase UbiE
MASESVHSNNPTFHKTTSAYSLPNDSKEHIRLEHQSSAINAMMGGKAIHSPLSKPAKILEVGCGTGHMTSIIAERFPSAKIYGVDLSPIPSSIRPKPQNVEFIQGNILELEDERLQEGTSDYIFHRMLVAGITDWPGYIKKCFTLLKPCGYLEMQDLAFPFHDINGKEISQDWDWFKIMREASLRRGVDLDCPLRFEPLMKAAGFVDIQGEEYKWPWSREDWDEYPESSEIRKYVYEDRLDKSMAVILGRIGDRLGWSDDERKRYLGSLEDDLFYKSKKGTHQRFWVYVGRKP